MRFIFVIISIFLTIFSLILFETNLAIASDDIGNLSVLELNKKIKENQTKIDSLKKKINEYQTKIRQIQQQKITLQNQINILDAGIEKTQLEIATRELEIEQLELEINLIEGRIDNELKNLAKTKNKIKYFLQDINRTQNSNLILLLASKNTFADIFENIFKSATIIKNLNEQLNTIKNIKSNLEESQKNLEQKKEETTNIKKELEESKATLEEEKALKERLFISKKMTEEEFQKTIQTLKEEAMAIDSEIVTLEKTIRQKLQIFTGLEGGKLAWPVNPLKGISAYFHDPDYPFRYIFEHTGIDIRVAQGTPVVAAAGGYVAKAYNGGLGDKPSYVLIIHANGFSTVYMHLSGINVSEGTYVARGQIIGSSGGTPGTPGAGRWTTGPHLHFEVRKDGIPVNPLDYLP